MSLIDFVSESNRIEGIFTVSQAELQAHKDFLAQPVSIASLQTFVQTVAKASLREAEGMDVRIGRHIAPRGGPLIRPALQLVLNITNRHRQHLEYLTLHPFMDGNGRSSRALWLHQRDGLCPNIGFLHSFYYETLGEHDARH